MRKSISAKMLVVCYCITWAVAAFHSHECCHEASFDGAVSIEDSCREAVPFNSRHQVAGAKISSPQCDCSNHGYGDCDQAQFFPNNRKAHEIQGWQVDLLSPIDFNESSFDLRINRARSKLYFLQPSILSSILCTRLLI